MGQLELNNVEADVQDKLRELARDRGQSIEQTAIDLLRTAVSENQAWKGKGLGSRLVELFRDCPLEKPIEELRGWKIQATQV